MTDEQNPTNFEEPGPLEAYTNRELLDELARRHESFMAVGTDSLQNGHFSYYWDFHSLRDGMALVGVIEKTKHQILSEVSECIGPDEDGE